MVINGSVFTLPQHQDQYHLQQVDSILFGPGTLPQEAVAKEEGRVLGKDNIHLLTHIY